MSNVLFVVPPYRTTDALVAQLYPIPLGAVTLGTILQQRGYGVRILDALAHPWAGCSSAAQRPESFNGLGGPPYRHYGAPMPEFLAALSTAAAWADVVCLCSCQCNLYETVAHVAHHINALEKPLVIGGPWATTDTARCIALCRPSVVVQGEGELQIERAIELALHVQPDGAVLSADRKANLDLLPLPDWSLAPPENYPKYNGRVRGVLTIGRGCPHRCEFCSVHTIVGRGYRRMSSARITEHVQNLLRFGVQYICFLDDNLVPSRAAMCELANVLRQFVGNGLRYYMEEGLEVRVAAQPGIVAELAALRFDNIAIGLETMSQAVRDRCKKPYNDEQLAAAVREFHSAGVTGKAFYVIGLPGDTLEGIARDIIDFGKLGLDVRANNLKLYPGTETTRKFIERGYIARDEMCLFDWRLSSFYTPDRPGLLFADIQEMKRYLAAIAMAAVQFGVDIFRGTRAECIAALARKGFKASIEDREVRLRGKMWRKSSYRRLAELLCLRFAKKAQGVRTYVEGDDVITALPRGAALHRAQAAMRNAMRREE